MVIVVVLLFFCFFETGIPVFEHDGFGDGLLVIAFDNSGTGDDVGRLSGIIGKPGSDENEICSELSVRGGEISISSGR